jgi:GAF domain-containing protein
MTSDRKGRRSDRPPSELQKERESFIQTFFKKGAQLTQELVKESDRLHQRVNDLEQDNAQLRSQIASDDAIRELLRKIEGLERERATLLSRYEEAEAASVRYVDQYTEVESELANLANLYVASYQLHGSLDPRTTVRNLKEMLEQLVGARAFAVYVSPDDGKTLFPVYSQGLGTVETIPVRADDGGMGEVFATSVPKIEKGDLNVGMTRGPLALIPMTVEGNVIGVLCIYAMLEQKSRFLPVDFELFKLVGAHAGRALVCARLFAESGQRIPSFDAVAQRDM